MPCFNAANYITKAITSVLSQNYPNLQLYVKDGGSTDKTVTIIKSFSKKYPGRVVFDSNKDNGQADAINIGIKKSKGDIIGYLNADDVLKPESLFIVAKHFQQNPDIKWLVGRSDIIDEKDNVIRKLITQYKNLWLSLYSYKTLLVINYIPQMSVFWKRDVIKSVGLFDPAQYYVMDYEYWLRLGKKYQPKVIPEYLSSFRIISTSKSSTGFKKQFEDEYNAAKKHTNNKLLLNLHKFHIKMITSIYTLIQKK